MSAVVTPTAPAVSVVEISVAAVIVAWGVSITGMAVVAGIHVVAAVGSDPAIAVAATGPGARSDEDASAEPGGTVVAVGRAGIRSVAIVSVGTDGSRIVDRASNADADGNLGVGIGGWNDQDCE